MDTRGGTCNSASMIQVLDFIITINFFFLGGAVGPALIGLAGVWIERCHSTDELIIYLYL